MPTYEFRCPSGHSFERFYRKIADAATELECPVCGKVAARQLSGGAGLLFKGSGFYLTDYGRNAHRKETAGAGASSDTGDAGAESKTDAKSAESKGDSKVEAAKSATSGGESKSSGAAKTAPKPEPKPPKSTGSSGGSTD